MKPFIHADLRIGTIFRNYTYWSNNDIRSHCLSHQVNNHHIDNEDLVSQPHFEGSVRSPLTLSKMGLGSPPRLPKT